MPKALGGMIPIEVLKQVTHVYTHAHCPDGLASAMILKDAFRMLGMAPKIEFLVHGTKEHAQAGISNDEVALFCDISPTPDVAQLTRDTGTVIVLDHHKGAEALVRSFGERGVFADEKLDPGVSGAVLAFREVWKSACRDQPVTFETVRRVEDFACCVGARDTWQTQDPRFMRGQWISKALMSKPASWWLGEAQPVPRAFLLDSEIETGRALFEAHEESVRQATFQCVAYDIETSSTANYRIFVFQEQAAGFKLTSDVAEWFRKNLSAADCPDVVAGWFYIVDKLGEDPHLVYSLRSVTDLVDVSKFAKANGGGGHTKAAGFSLRPGGEEGMDPYNYVQLAFEEFLTVEEAQHAK